MKKLTLLITAIVISLSLGQVSAQTRAEMKKAEQAAMEAQVAEIVEKQHFKFIATTANTNLSNMQSVGLEIGPHYLEISKDEIVSELPFLGTTSGPSMNQTESLLIFKTKDFTYDKQVKKKRKGDITIIEISANVVGKPLTNLILEIQPSGFASLTVIRADLSNISYIGQIVNLIK